VAAGVIVWAHEIWSHLVYKVSLQSLLVGAEVDPRELWGISGIFPPTIMVDRQIAAISRRTFHSPRCQL
jgi:hypothetical protein